MPDYILVLEDGKVKLVPIRKKPPLPIISKQNLEELKKNKL